MPLMDLEITESQVVSWAVIVSVLALCLFVTRGLSVKPQGKRQVIAEFIVEKASSFTVENMGERLGRSFAPFVAAIMALSALSSLSSLLGLHPPTSDINVVAGWAILVFVLITYYKLKGGLWNYVKGFGDPIPVFAPFNVISEVATPISMAFRHYGNVLSGVVISTLIATALQGLSKMVLGWLPGFLGTFPLLQVGLPAILSLYFDLFSGCLQAFIFAMLTMLYIANGFPEEEYEKRLAKKQARKAA
ncbi:MAG: F0F1 ATP synthase subunit A [Clostridia bacterium]|nr:F0F1 ATP synthase subunit A [Clostridia bacterium]